MSEQATDHDGDQHARSRASAVEGRHTSPVAATPDPPYTAVIFTSRRTTNDDGYDETAVQMATLASRQPGYLGIESVHDPHARHGITVSYWETAAHATAWKQVAEHLVAQQLGRTRWYDDYRVRVATVERAYGPAS